MSKNENDILLNDALEELDEEIARFSLHLERCEQQIKDLMAQEDPASGIFFASEIFTLQQEKLRLRVEIDYRQKKKKRLLAGY